MCTVLLPPGENPTAVNKYININKTVQFAGNISNAESQMHTLLTLHPSSWVDLCNHLILPETTSITENHFNEFLYGGEGNRQWIILMKSEVKAYCLLQCCIQCACYITMLTTAKFIQHWCDRGMHEYGATVDKWQVLPNVAVNLWGPWNVGNFLTHWWTVSFSQRNYNMVGRCDLLYAEMSKKQHLCKTDELSPAGGCVRQNWEVKSDIHMQGTSWQLTIRRMAPHIAYIFDVSVIRPVCGSTSAMLIWIEAWSLAWIIRLLAELKYNCPCEFWGSHGSDYKENEANVFCDTALGSHLPNNSASHPVRQLLARLFLS